MVRTLSRMLRPSAVIAVGVRHFPDQTVGSQHSQFPADGGGATAPFAGRVGRLLVKQGLQIPVA